MRKGRENKNNGRGEEERRGKTIAATIRGENEIKEGIPRPRKLLRGKGILTYVRRTT